MKEPDLWVGFGWLEPGACLVPLVEIHHSPLKHERLEDDIFFFGGEGTPRELTRWFAAGGSFGAGKPTLQPSHHHRHENNSEEIFKYEKNQSKTRPTRKRKRRKTNIVNEKSRRSIYSVILFLVLILKTLIKVFAKCIHQDNTFNPSELIENRIFFNSRGTIQRDSWCKKRRKTKTKKNMSQAAFSNFRLKKTSFASSTPCFFLGRGDSQYWGRSTPSPPTKLRIYIYISFEQNPFLLEVWWFFEMNKI